MVIGAVFAVLAMTYSLFLYRYQVHHDQWYAPSDVWMTVDGGRFVWRGALGYAYMGTNSYALPLSFILSAPIAELIDIFHLVEGLFPLAHPSAWLVVGPFSLLFNVFLLDALRRLLWEFGIRRQLWLAQVGAVVLVLVPAFQFGHYEDVLALTFLLHAFRLSRTRNMVASALLLSLAISSKQWALALVPWFVFTAPRGSRTKVALAALALPLAFVGMVAAVDPNNGLSALFAPTMPKLSFIGHWAVFAHVFGSRTPQVTRTAALVGGVAVAWAFRKRTSGTAAFTTAAIILLLRPLSEPVNFAYYWSPGLLLACVAAARIRSQIRATDWIAPGLAAIWALTYNNLVSVGTWWVVELVFLGLTAGTLVLAWRKSGRPSTSPPVSGDEASSRGMIEVAHQMSSNSTALWVTA